MVGQTLRCYITWRRWSLFCKNKPKKYSQKSCKSHFLLSLQTTKWHNFVLNARFTLCNEKKIVKSFTAFWNDKNRAQCYADQRESKNLYLNPVKLCSIVRLESSFANSFYYLPSPIFCNDAINKLALKYQTAIYIISSVNILPQNLSSFCSTIMISFGKIWICFEPIYD